MPGHLDNRLVPAHAQRYWSVPSHIAHRRRAVVVFALLIFILPHSPAATLAHGTYFPRARSLEMLSGAVNAPIVMFSTLIDRVIVDGYIGNFAGQGREASKTASRIPGGTKPQNIPAVVGTNAFLFDSKIPRESRIIFRPSTEWERYKYKIIAMLVFFAAETALVIFLIWGVRRRILAQQVLERQVVLEEASHMNRVSSMGYMAASLAHELAQPLAAILGNAQAAERLAKRHPPDMVEIRAALADIREDNKRAQAVLENMRALFKKKTIARHEVDLNEVVIGVSRLVKKYAQLRGIELRLILSDKMPRVLGDEIPLQQIVVNLINNGMDAMRDVRTDRRVLAVTTRVDADSTRGLILVEDNGQGIAEMDKTKLFTPFFTTKSEGLGMGLSICRSILDSLGGRISFYDRPDGGTVFSVELPLATTSDLLACA